MDDTELTGNYIEVLRVTAGGEEETLGYVSPYDITVTKTPRR